jgi:hypothetical protein
MEGGSKGGREGWRKVSREGWSDGRKKGGKEGWILQWMVRLVKGVMDSWRDSGIDIQKDI